MSYTIDGVEHNSGEGVRINFDPREGVSDLRVTKIAVDLARFSSHRLERELYAITKPDGEVFVGYATPEGDVPYFSLETINGGGGMEISVANTGKGLPDKEDRQDILEAYVSNLEEE